MTKTLLARASQAVALALLTTCATGCKSFLDQSELTRGPRAERLVVPILSSIDPIDQAETEFPGATDIRPDDLKVSAVDYRITAGDLVTVSVYDLVQGGVESMRSARVSETGMLSLPLLGDPIRATGSTESALQKSIADRYREAGILQNAQVSVTVTEARGRTFSALGAVGRPGQYLITEADFRMLDALIQVGDTTYPAEYAYILRRREQDEGSGVRGQGSETNDGMTPAPGTNTPGPNSPGPVITPPSETNPAATPGTGTTTPPPTDLSPRGALDSGTGVVVRPVLALQQPTTEERYIYVDGKPVLVPTTQATPGTNTTTTTTTTEQTTIDRSAVTGAAAQPTVDASVTMQPTEQGSGVRRQGSVSTADLNSEPSTLNPGQRPYAFGTTLEAPEDVRIIRVPLAPLRMGDLRYNLIIRPGDRIIIPAATIGEYYIGGHASGGGVFSLSGRQITLKQAIVSARMLDPLAVPWRTDIVRRVGRDKEVFVRVNLALIFEGRQPDLFLKPNDVITVGTDWYAPFLAAIRGAFRVSYGFGFLYDRNFAPQQEPSDADIRNEDNVGGGQNLP